MTVSLRGLGLAHALVVAMAASLIGGCASEPPVTSPTEGTAATSTDGGLTQAQLDEPMIPEQAPGCEVDLSSQGPTTLLPEVEPLVRARQRMNLDQLSAAISRASGGIGWTEGAGNNEKDLFVELAATLGSPDYIEITTEDLDASALFHKFLDDAARQVCTTLVDQEAADPTLERTLMKYVEPSDTLATNPDGVTDNLRYLLLRFHGHRVNADTPVLEQWRWLFQTVSTFSAGDALGPATGWRAVCVALITHPDFYSY